MELIAEGKVVDRAASDAMIALMREQAFRTMIPRALPETDDVLIANKPGWDSEKHPDAAGVKRAVRGDVRHRQHASRPLRHRHPGPPGRGPRARARQRRGRS
jgi:hypothetical protein